MAPTAPAAAREVAPAEGVDVMVEALRIELAMLEESVARAEAEADELERLLETAPSSRSGDSGALMRLTKFLDQFGTDSTARRLESLIDARRQATERVTQARLEAERIRREGLSAGPEPVLPASQNPELVAAGSVDVAGAEPGMADPAAGAAIGPEVGLLAGDLEEQPEEAASVDSGDVTDTAAPPAAALPESPLLEIPDPAVAADAAGPGPVVDPGPPPAPAEVVDASALAAWAPPMAPGLPEAGASAVVVGPDQVEERFVEFWDAQREAEGDRWWSWIPIDALLPMVALLIVLVVVLAWIG